MLKAQLRVRVPFSPRGALEEIVCFCDGTERWSHKRIVRSFHGQTGHIPRASTRLDPDTAPPAQGLCSRPVPSCRGDTFNPNLRTGICTHRAQNIGTYVRMCLWSHKLSLLWDLAVFTTSFQNQSLRCVGSFFSVYRSVAVSMFLQSYSKFTLPLNCHLKLMPSKGVD